MEDYNYMAVSSIEHHNESKTDRAIRICVEQKVPFVVDGGNVWLASPTAEMINKLTRRGVNVLGRGGRVCQLKLDVPAWDKETYF